MSFEEKTTWSYAVIALGAYGYYVATVLGRVQGSTFGEVAYVDAILWAIGGAIVASIVVSIIISIIWPRDANKKDQRDRDIDRRGEYVAGLVLGVSAIAPFVLALVEVDHFWIANALYLAFVLSAVVGTIVKLVAYRRGI